MSSQPKAKASAKTRNVPIKLTLYKWAGQWGPFKVKIPCGECALTADVIQDTLGFELANANIEYEVKDWLSHWWEPLLAGGWHAPIVIADGHIIGQGEAINRGVLAEHLINEHVARFNMQGNHVFGKDNCKHCTRAKAYLDEAGIAYTYHDCVKNPGAMYEMLARVKPLVGKKTPITTPQIWLNGTYIGGADQLADHLGIARAAQDAPKARKALLGGKRGSRKPAATLAQ